MSVPKTTRQLMSSLHTCSFPEAESDCTKALNLDKKVSLFSHWIIITMGGKLQSNNADVFSSFVYLSVNGAVAVDVPN